VRGWLPLYTLSVRLGLRYLLTRGYLREALIRIAVPLDPSRYLELPDALRELGAAPGQAVLDLASPKLAAVFLARQGVRVTSVDALQSEVESWRKLAAGQEGVEFVLADGRELPYGEASYDHAYSISVLEHIEDDGDEVALRELARVVRPGGRVVVTLPYADRYHEDWRTRPVYGAGAARDGRYFFERWYDEGRVERLAAGAPGLRHVASRVSRMSPNWHRLYVRTFPWLVALGPLYGVLGRERVGPPGDVVRLTFLRR